MAAGGVHASVTVLVVSVVVLGTLLIFDVDAAVPVRAAFFIAGLSAMLALFGLLLTSPYDLAPRREETTRDNDAA